MIIDTLVVVVCLIADTPRLQYVEQVPADRFAELFHQADSLFEVASDKAMKNALRKTKFERYRALGIISQEDYVFLKKAEKELEQMKTLRRKVGGKQ